MRVHGYGCLTAAFLWLSASPVCAQMPSMKANGNDPNAVYLQKLSVDVVIQGAIATTTWTMTFKNSTNRIIEGELNFPLPPEAPVSRYALDINGVLREAVPVEKAKATEVFESTERRRVDPGILEKVDGNTFRTRIYPFGAFGVRTVRIGYEQELSWEGGTDLRYRLPLAFSHPIEDFKIHISVPGVSQRPGFDEHTDDALQFDEWKEVWSASHEWKNYLADRPIAIRIPQRPGVGAILMQQEGNRYYYTVSVFPRQERIAKPSPRHITLLWDASLSGLRRDRKKEFELLDAYFEHFHDMDVDLIPFSNTVGEVRRFTVQHADWQALKKALEDIVYDGGTQFGALHLNDHPCDEFLLFSDGHSTFGSDQAILSKTPVYAVTAAADADFPFLRSLSGRTGGELVDLGNMSMKQASDLLCYQTLKFLGVRSDHGLEESYPSQPVTISGALTVAGICDLPARDIVLQYGYGNTVARAEKITLDYPRQQASGVDLERIWAEKKIAELDMRFEENKDEIRHLGKRYGIVTRNTSLLVLENVMDYVNNEIDPPADLREQYDRILKGREQDFARQHERGMGQAGQYFNELLAWWRGEPEKTKLEKEESRNAPVSALEGRVPGLAAAGSNLDEVVVVGYGTQNKRAVRIRGAASVARDEKIKLDDEAGPAPVGGHFTILKADVDTRYLQELKAAAPGKRYALYLELRKDNLNTPLFYFHTAELFLGAGEKALGLRILSNIAELDAENYELYKLMAYKLKEAGSAEDACAAFRKVLEWRPFEPQSYRDYGLALEDAGHYQRALDTLYLALTKNYDQAIQGLYPGIEEILLPEINELIARHSAGLDARRLPKKLLVNMPVDMRVVLNWNQNNTDIDLWVTDPDNERCFYGHRFTAIGGRISHDFTRGLGPEQFLLKKAVKGRYKVEVNYYGDTQVKIAGETTLLVEVYTHYGTAAQKRELVTLQLQRGGKGASYVGEFEF
ncbi:MAG TPA: VIT domain-containing protein [Puia sp.]|nr:VIT domain-containing protein [Puia sp.]